MRCPRVTLALAAAALSGAGCTVNTRVSDLVDQDDDGWTVGQGDCDDLDPHEHPEGIEACDGLDNDCNGHVDDEAVCSVTDVVTQHSVVDVLIVLDNSYSMQGLDDRIIDEVPDFVRHAFDRVPTDLHLGVVTTGSGGIDAGLLQVRDGARFASSARMSDVAATAWLRDALTVAPHTGAAEHIRRTIEATLDHAETENAGFFRPDAGLFVIVITDEDDDVDDRPRADELLHALQARVGQDRVRFNAIVALDEHDVDPEGCATMVGESHMALARDTRGNWGSLCGDYLPLMEVMGQDAHRPGLRTSFALSEEPQYNSIRVDIETPLGLETTLYPDEFNYNPRTGELRLVGAPPVLGSTLTVRYERVPVPPED